MSKDYYKILGLEKNASAEEIKKAFRTLAHQYHPDKPTGNAAKFKEINEAYQTLSDSTKRSQYDQFGSNYENMGGFGGASGFNWSDMGGGFNGDFGDLGDIFGDFFGGAMGGSRGRKSSRGKDMEFSMTLDFLEAAFGVKKDISVTKNSKCTHCSGTGGEPGSQKITCKTCNGRGQISKIKKTIIGNIQTASICDDCGGAGSSYDKKCTQCKASGVVRATEVITVEVPAGIEDGMSIKLNGRGEAGPNNAPSGDIYLHVAINGHKKFTRERDTVYSIEYVSYSTMVLGGKIDVETIHGPVTLKVPDGTPSGKEFLLKGKGIAKFQRSGLGDHIVKLIVDVPTSVTRQERKIIEELGSLEGTVD